jgi:hypothetical protein
VESFEFDVAVSAGLVDVVNAFWRLEDWPEVASHVREIEMHYCDENVQVLTMHVVTKGRHDKFKSIRMKQGEAIYYLQPTPPPILHRHNGSWQFAQEAGKTVVTSRHFVEINTREAIDFLREAKLDKGNQVRTHEQIKNLIRNNSLQTMLALKNRIEQKNGGDYVPPAIEARDVA